MENAKKFNCKICDRNFTRSGNLKLHVATKHNKVSLDFSCYLCRKNFRKQEKYLKHIDNNKEGRKVLVMLEQISIKIDPDGGRSGGHRN